MKTELHEALSHGLRTPLTSVLGFSATLLERWDDLGDAERMAFIRVVYAEALKMADSVEAVDRQLADGLAPAQARSDGFKGLHGLADAG
jgi:K+-sensing histidine kinase KdpD